VGPLVSGEGVSFDLPRAGVGSRTIAGLIDLSLQVAALLLVILADAAVAVAADSAAVGAVVIVELVGIFGGYPVLMEWLTRGRTVGKLALGLRVVRDDGGPIGFRQALVRGLSSLLLEKPGLFFPIGPAIAMITMAATPSTKRIGDLMAGTFVLAERAGRPSSVAVPVFDVPYPIRPWAMSLDLTRLDDHLALGIRQFVLRAHEMTPAARDQLGADFQRRVLAVVSPPPPPGTPTPAVLMAVLAERRRRAELAIGPYPAAWSAPPEPPVWSAAAAGPAPVRPDGPPPAPSGFAAPQ
jgi:uncharacterized RDD family membrane protein YckC